MPIRKILKECGIEEKLFDVLEEKLSNYIDHLSVMDILKKHFGDMEHRYRTIIRSDLPIVMTGPDMKTIIEVSDGAVDYWGYNRGEMANKNVRELYDDPNVRKQMEKGFKEGKLTIRGVRFRTKNRMLKFANVYINSIKDDEGQITGTLGIAIDRTREKALEKKAVNNFLGALRIQIDALEAKYPEYKGHSKRVAETTCDFIIKYQDELKQKFDAQLVDYYRKNMERLRLFVRLHDYGKVDITKSELRNPKIYKRGKNPVARHAAEGDALMQVYLGELDYPYDEDLKNVIRLHHERWDGKGYPDILKGEKIPLLPRIVNIFDSYDAIRSDRPYKKRRAKKEALKELKRCAGMQFDPVLIPLIVRYLSEKKETA
jgi:PAS domain S-box-containing protein